MIEYFNVGGLGQVGTQPVGGVANVTPRVLAPHLGHSQRGVPLLLSTALVHHALVGVFPTFIVCSDPFPVVVPLDSWPRNPDDLTAQLHRFAEGNHLGVRTVYDSRRIFAQLLVKSAPPAPVDANPATAVQV